MAKNWIEGKTVLLTGASSGIGRELSKLLINKSGCHVIGVGRNQEKFQMLKTELGENGNNFEYMISDVSKIDSWIDIRHKIKNKNVSVVINNAGILPSFCSLDKMFNNHQNDDECIKVIHNIIETTIDTNLMSVIYSTALLSPIIEKNESPAIINISSSAGLCALPGISIYSASKGGVKNFTESLMCEKKYYVGLVCPGFTRTNIFRYQKNNSDSKLVNLISSDMTKMAQKIYNGIKRKRRRMVFGFDAKIMDKLYRFMPKTSIRIFTNILKKTNIDLFSDIF